MCGFLIRCVCRFFKFFLNISRMDSGFWSRFFSLICLKGFLFFFFFVTQMQAGTDSLPWCLALDAGRNGCTVALRDAVDQGLAWLGHTVARGALGGRALFLFAGHPVLLRWGRGWRGRRDLDENVSTNPHALIAILISHYSCHYQVKSHFCIAHLKTTGVVPKCLPLEANQ